MNKKVSIIVPVYNVVEFVHDSILSCINQTYSNIEVIAIDDGSNDGSTEKIKNLANQFSNLISIRTANHGLSSARNKGLSVATGDYVLFVDSDDLLVENAVERLVKLLDSKKNNIDVVFFSSLRIPSDTKMQVASSAQKNKLCFRETNSNSMMIKLLKREIENYSWSMLVRRSVYTENSIVFPINRKYEDVGTTYKIIGNSSKILVTDAKLYLYRIRDSSITNSYSEKTFNDIIATLKEMEIFLKEEQPQNFNIYFDNFAISFLLLAYYDNFMSGKVNRRNYNELIRAKIIEYESRGDKNKFIQSKFKVACMLVKLRIFNFVQYLRIHLRKN
ncbi:glycosyltransferase family 2 protein [Lactiplantibacillus pentosus]|uniref:glycosyltransferase family 2 protein n=1 Tax=Lactiplantibacillus pentosus TaxID=1589 RepID=UPI003C295330